MPWIINNQSDNKWDMNKKYKHQYQEYKLDQEFKPMYQHQLLKLKSQKKVDAQHGCGHC